MKPKIAFLLEQSLGHVAYGMSLKRVIGRRSDFHPIWLEVPYEPGRFGALPIVGSNWTLRGSYRAWRLLRRTLAREPLSALFVNTQTIGLLSGHLMRRVPTLLSLDATPVNYDQLAPWYGDRVHPAVVEKAKLQAHRSMMKNVSWFTTWSQWARRSLVTDYGVDAERVTVIAPGVTLPKPKRAASSLDRPLRLLFVGGDFERKGGDLLLDVYRAHFRNRAELHLVTGAPVDAEPGVVVHRGLRPQSPELRRLYEQADVFVLPTRADCLAVVLGEAMAAGLPIITTRVGAHAEVVEDGHNGFLLDPDDAAGLRCGIERLIGEPELRRAMGARSRALAETDFDIEKNAGRIADLLLRLAGTHPARPAATLAPPGTCVVT